MDRKTKKILLISGIGIGATTIIVVPVVVVITNKNNEAKIIQLNNDFVNYINAFIQLNKISNGEWFNNQENLLIFQKYINDTLKNVNFDISIDNNLITFKITNNFVFDNTINVSNVSFDMENSKIAIVDVVWYDPNIYIINSFNIYNYIQNYITKNKITRIIDLDNDKFKKSILQDYILLENPDLTPQLTADDINIIVDEKNPTFVNISINLYVNAIFNISTSSSNVTIIDPEIAKELSIMNLELYNTEINIDSSVIEDLQSLVFSNNIIFPSSLEPADSPIEINNVKFKNEIVDLFNSTILENDYKLSMNDINSLTMSLIDKQGSYSNYLPNVAKIKLSINLDSSINFGFVNLDNLDSVSITNDGKTLNVDLYCFNGLIVNEAMINSSTRINEFIKINNIELSNANDKINNQEGNQYIFWYIFLYNKTINDDIPDEFYDVINTNLYTMTFGSSYINITLNDNCGYRFFSNNGNSIQGDIIVSNDNKTITINNISWPNEKIQINTNGITSQFLSQVFAELKINDYNQIERYKSEIISRVFNNKLPPENCTIQYDSNSNSINFQIVNNSNSNISYIFVNDNIETNSFKIDNVEFPSTIISPISNYLNLVQKSIFNNSICTTEDLNNYINSIITSIFSNGLDPTQYTYEIVDNNVTLTINDDVNIEIQISPDNKSKTFTFPFTLCTEILIDSNYQNIITKAFLNDNGITIDNINDQSSISTILNAIILNENKDEIISTISKMITIVYSDKGESTLSLSDQLVNVDSPFAFSVDNNYSKSIKIIFNFSVDDETPSTDDTNPSLKFFSNY